MFRPVTASFGQSHTITLKWVCSYLNKGCCPLVQGSFLLLPFWDSLLYFIFYGNIPIFPVEYLATYSFLTWNLLYCIWWSSTVTQSYRKLRILLKMYSIFLFAKYSHISSDTFWAIRQALWLQLAQVTSNPNNKLQSTQVPYSFLTQPRQLPGVWANHRLRWGHRGQSCVLGSAGNGKRVT